MTLRELVSVALFMALGVVLGLALISVPNVELVTATFFLSGYFLGPARGSLTGALGELLYSLLNPYGMSAPPLLVAQVLSMAMVGFVGGMARRIPLNPKPFLITSLAFGAMGLGLTFLFDSLTTLGFLILSGLTLANLLAAYLYGLGFYLVHMASNAAVFALLVPLLLRLLQGKEIFRPKWRSGDLP